MVGFKVTNYQEICSMSSLMLNICHVYLLNEVNIYTTAVVRVTVQNMPTLDLKGHTMEASSKSKIILAMTILVACLFLNSYNF